MSREQQNQAVLNICSLHKQIFDVVTTPRQCYQKFTEGRKFPKQQIANVRQRYEKSLFLPEHQTQLDNKK